MCTRQDSTWSMLLHAAPLIHTIHDGTQPHTDRDSRKEQHQQTEHQTAEQQTECHHSSTADSTKSRHSSSTQRAHSKAAAQTDRADTEEGSRESRRSRPQRAESSRPESNKSRESSLLLVSIFFINSCSPNNNILFYIKYITIYI